MPTARKRKRAEEVPVTVPAQQANPNNLPVVYDSLTIAEYSTKSALGPVTVAKAKVDMGWETEGDYQQRMVAERGGELAHYLYGDVFHCLDTEKKKVRCNNNAGNRPFDEAWCQDLIHTILHGHWARPHTIPGETVNCEIVRISRYGRVISGQHQYTALIMANQFLQKARQAEGTDAVAGKCCTKYPFWDGHDEPFIETLVATGMSENPRVLQTVDYVKPRSVADMLYTMELFRTQHNGDGTTRDSTPKERQELTRMLSAAIDLLWSRAGTKGYKTHPEVVGFLERHKRLLKCVEHLFILNSAAGPEGGRKISNLKLSPGQCAALCYLMGSSGPGTNGAIYRNQSPPSEKGLDWSLWQRASEFWGRLASHTSDATMRPVRIALNSLVETRPTAPDENKGLGGRIDEKFAILSKAWEIWRDHEGTTAVFDLTDNQVPDGRLVLSYTHVDANGNRMPEGEIRLLDDSDFGGIDYVRGAGTDTEAPIVYTPEEMDQAREAARARRAAR